MKTLVIYGHSTPEQSLANSTIIAELKNVPNVTVRTLAEQLKNGEFDIEAEQKAVAEADRYVFQFPFNWYAFPWLLKKWVDEVLTFGFAYGDGGDKLKNKPLILSFTTGVPEAGYAKPTEDELLLPIKATFGLMGVKLESFEKSNGMMYIPGIAGDKDEVVRKALEQAKRLSARLK